MQFYKKIAKDMEKDFRKKNIKCPKCNKALKFKAVSIDNIEAEPIAIECRKCGYMHFDPVTREQAIKEVRIAYSQNKKVRDSIISHLKKGLLPQRIGNASSKQLR